MDNPLPKQSLADLRHILIADLEQYTRRPTGWPGILGCTLTWPGFRAVAIYRFSSYFFRKGHRRIAHFLLQLNITLHASDISAQADIGPGLCLPHPIGIVIGNGVRIGSHATLYQNVTLGMRLSRNEPVNLGFPTIGDHAFITSGASLFGGIHVGDNVSIGANTVVLTDIPDDHTAMGLPAQLRPARFILGITGQNQNATLAGATETYGHILTQAGYRNRIINLASAPNVDQLNTHIQRGNISFAFGLQGVGSRLTTGNSSDSLWTALKTPYIALHHDHPCYNPSHHSSDSPYVANLYFFESFLETKQKYLPSAQISRAVPFAMPLIPPPKAQSFSNRPIKLLYLKNGSDIPDLAAYEQALQPPVREALRHQIALARENPNLLLADLVADMFTALALDRHAHQEAFWTLIKLMDHLLRRERSIAFVEWLKGQEGALIIGDGWNFIDKSDARAIFKPAMPASEAAALYEQTQIICNTNPYGRDIVHERVLFGLAAGACVFSDSNQWWDQNAAAIDSLTLFDWRQPLADQLQPRLSNMRAMAEAAQGSYAAYRRAFPEQDIKALVTLAEEVKNQAGRDS